jgi:probable rRNA maturation factor
MVFLRKRIPGATAALLERFVRRAGRATELSGVVNVLITNDSEMRILNRRFCGKDTATDVLSFPAAPGLPGKLAGDLAISADIAAASAKRFGHTTGEEIKVLILHGVLHLAGYDHEQDGGRMAKKEEHLRREMKLPVTLIARATTETATISRTTISRTTISRTTLSRATAAGSRKVKTSAKRGRKA